MLTCKSCGAPIMFIRTERGKVMPCNPEEVRFERSGGPETFITGDGRVQRGKRDPSGRLYGHISHFATCPNADHHRKKTQNKNS